MRRTRSPVRPVGRPRPIPGIDSRERLLNAAVTLFARKGIAATPIAEIAAQAGVTAAMVHYYFTDRQRLLDAVCDERLLSNVNAVWASVAESNASMPDVVRTLVQRIMHAAKLQPWLPSLWLREIVSEGGQLRERLLSRLPLGHVQTFIAQLTTAKRRGEVTASVEPRLVFVSVIGLTLLPLATMNIWRRIPQLQRISHDELARHAESLLLHGLFAARSKSRRRR
jgi:TetR/AcrR family transcriptional regulator